VQAREASPAEIWNEELPEGGAVPRALNLPIVATDDQIALNI
jgi:hypothetical protein